MTIHGITEKVISILNDPDKVKAVMGASFLLSLTLLFFGPSYIYYTNLLEIPFYYTDLVLYFVAYSLVTGAILSIILILLNSTVHQRAVTIVFVLGLLFWIQGNILVWDYGVLDGRTIIWEDYLINGIIDSTIWIAILALALFKGPSFYKHIALASLLLLIIQGGGLMAEIYLAPDEPEWKSYDIGYDEMFEFSSEQNVIILVLDAFRSDVFQEIIEENPEYRDMFDGFIFYRNAVSGFPYTDLAPTLLLTGKYYDNSVPRSEFIKNAFLENSIPLKLKENGYYVGLYPHMAGTVYFSEKTSSNIGSTNHGRLDRIINQQKGLMKLHHIALFRYVPHFMKVHFHFMPFIGSGVYDQIPHDLIFYNTLNSEYSVSNEKKVFMFYHNNGPHAPLNLNANLMYEELPFNHLGYTEQAKASLRISYELITKLKESEIYNKSMIFIIADHGAYSSGHGVRDEINISLLGDYIPSNSYRDNLLVVAQGTPLILVKPFNTTGDLTISDAPVTLEDIPQTIANEFELSPTFSGQSMFLLNESDNRERQFFRYIGTREEYDAGYLPTLRKYKIVGHSWFTNSWEPTVHMYEPGKGLLSLPTYEYSTSIIFGRNGTAQQYQLAGWSDPENGFTWTDGRESHLCLLNNTIPDSAFFTMNASAFTCPGISNQTVLIAINNKKISDHIIMDNRIQNIVLPIPSGCLVNGTNTITINIPNATSPKSLGLSEDTRDLGIAVRTVALTTSPPDEYNIGDIIRFENGGNSVHYLSKGWSITEPVHTWTDGNEANINLFIDTIPDSVFFTMNASAFTCPGISNQTVLIAVNNKKISDPIIMNNRI